MFGENFQVNNIVLSLGSNIGDRLRHLSAAITYLEVAGVAVTKQSSVYETEPWGNSDQSAFYNQVIEAETEMKANELMRQILLIEKKIGRERKKKWAPRIIDIDILFFNAEIIDEESLSVPHPHLHERRFVLAPLDEILPRKVHPVLHKSVSELLNSVNDRGDISKLMGISHG